MYKKDTKKWLKHADFIIIDFICLQLSMVVAYFIRFGFGNPYADDVYRNVDIVAELISLFVIIYFETMQDILKRGKYQEFVKTLPTGQTTARSSTMCSTASVPKSWGGT